MGSTIIGDSRSEKFFSRLSSKVRNYFDSDEKTQKKLESMLSEKTDEIFSLLLSLDLDRDKAEVLNRLRSRMDMYLEVKELDAKYYLEDLKSAIIKTSNPAPLTEKDLKTYREKFQMISAISSPPSSLQPI